MRKHPRAQSVQMRSNGGELSAMIRSRGDAVRNNTKIDKDSDGREMRASKQFASPVVGRAAEAMVLESRNGETLRLRIRPEPVSEA